MIVVEHVARLARYTIAVFEAFLFLLGVLTLIFLLLVGPMARQGHAKDSQPKSSPAASKPIAANAEPAAKSADKVVSSPKPTAKTVEVPIKKPVSSAKVPALQPELSDPVKEVQPVKQAASPRVKPVQASIPAIFELHALQGIRTLSQPLTVDATIRALQPISVCLNRSEPEKQLALTVWRQGFGQLEKGNVEALTMVPKAKQHITELKPGDVMTFKVNLRDATSISDAQWVTGDYRFQGALFLGCSAKAPVIPVKAPLHLVLVEY